MPTKQELLEENEWLKSNKKHLEFMFETSEAIRESQKRRIEELEGDLAIFRNDASLKKKPRPEHLRVVN